MDGIFRDDPPRIEEIKSSFAVRELADRLAKDPLDHPYGLQLLTYGYFHWLEAGVLPRLAFHLVSTRSGESVDLALDLDLSDYEKWLEQRLAELVVETRKAEERAARRKKTARSFTFPFANLRPGQAELMRTVEQGMAEGRRMLLQAPTGLGKTAAVLSPVLKEALSRGRQAVYVTPKNSQHAVAEDAVRRLQDAGAKVRSLTITAKGKICFQDEPLCDPAYCEYAKDHYTKMAQHGVLDLLAKKRKLTARTFRKLAEEHGVCPFELQFDGADEADVVICDYNYVFAPRSPLGGKSSRPVVDQEGRPNLVIDEAHNLPHRAMDYYSPSISTALLEELRGGLASLPPRFRSEALTLLGGCIDVVAACRPGGSNERVVIDPPVLTFFGQDASLRSFLARYLDSDIDIAPRDPVLRLCRQWAEFSEALEYAGDPDHDEFFTTFQPLAAGGIVRITCCDASEMLRDRYDNYEHTVGFSATLKPFSYYARLSGLDPDTVKTAEFASPFPKEQRKLLIIPQVSTKYSDRERNYGRIAGAIERISALRRGNYFAFFPSFEFLDRVLALFAAPEGFRVVRQERDMKAREVEEVLEHLRAEAEPSIVFAVQGGTFAEGVDYPGEMVIGAFVVGPPLPTFDLEREEMRKYYQRRYNAGFDYAYAIPAMAKTVQAAGRVIRSETDRGLVVLLDSRFVEPGYARAMPADWFVSDAKELVSEGILKDVEEFWKGTSDR
jgi:DNA excision repair protein ERCC-2